MADRNMVLLRNANGISPKIHNGGMYQGRGIYYDMGTGRGVWFAVRAPGRRRSPIDTLSKRHGWQAGYGRPL